jgi:hypothetical protein
VLVFTGTCTEADVRVIRDELKLVDERYEASIIQDFSQLYEYETATLEHPNGYKEPRKTGAASGG